MKIRKFKVIADTCGGRGNKIYNGGEIVTENDFSPGVADSLVSRKFLKEISPENEPDLSLETQNKLEDAFKDGPDNVNADLRKSKSPSDIKEMKEVITDKHDLHPDDPDYKEPAKSEIPEIKSNEINGISVDQIIKDLQENQIKFDVNASKEELYKLWLLI